MCTLEQRQNASRETKSEFGVENRGEKIKQVPQSIPDSVALTN